jgi:hypothetical protein
VKIPVAGLAPFPGDATSQEYWAEQIVATPITMATLGQGSATANITELQAKYDAAYANMGVKVAGQYTQGMINSGERQHAAEVGKAGCPALLCVIARCYCLRRHFMQCTTGLYAMYPAVVSSPCHKHQVAVVVECAALTMVSLLCCLLLRRRPHAHAELQHPQPRHHSCDSPGSKCQALGALTIVRALADCKGTLVSNELYAQVRLLVQALLCSISNETVFKHMQYSCTVGYACASSVCIYIIVLRTAYTCTCHSSYAWYLLLDGVSSVSAVGC